MKLRNGKITHCGGKRVENNGRLRLTLYYSLSSEDNSNLQWLSEVCQTLKLQFVNTPRVGRYFTPGILGTTQEYRKSK